MNSKYSILCVVLCLIPAGTWALCKNPKVSDEKSFTTENGQIVNEVAYISEFTLKCDNEGGQLFAEYEGRISPVARVGENKYQVSWSEDMKTSKSGNYNVRLFDEDGFAALRKAQRSGENVNSVNPIATVTVKHRGVHRGAWINSEVLATGLVGIVAYVAFSAKSQIVA